MTEPTLEQASHVVEALLGRHPDRIDQWRPVVGGSDGSTFRVRAGHDDLLLQVRRQQGRPIGVTFQHRLREAGLPVPDLIAFSQDAGPHGHACALWTWVEGVPAEWGSDEPCPYDPAELGTLLRRIHDLRWEGAFGFLGDRPANRASIVPSTPDLGPVSDTWLGFFHCDRAARRYRANGYLDRREAAVLALLPDRLAHLFGNVEARLLHMGDLMHNGNLLLAPETGRIVAVLDFADATAGDPRWELAWFDYYFAAMPFGRPSFDLDRFWAGYGARYAPDDVVGRFYLAVILLFEKLSFYDPRSPRGRWAIATVKEILRAVADV